jgi:hypothetical protein
MPNATPLKPESTKASTHAKPDFTYSASQLSQTLRLAADMYQKQETVNMFSLRHNKNSLWGNTTDSAFDGVSVQEAATQQFYKEKRDTNALLINIQGRRKATPDIQVRSGNTGKKEEKMDPESIILDF